MRTNRPVVLVGILTIVLSVSGLQGALAAIPGAIFTTDVNGVPVNQNHFADKCDVYLNGGPGPTAPPWAAGLPAGDYYFQVTDPSGNVLLSSDAIGERAFQVTTGVITAYLGSTHNWNVVGPPEIVVQLCPYADTPNPGGEYKVWATLQSDYSPGSGKHGFLPSQSKTDNFKVAAQGEPPIADCGDGDVTVFEGDAVTFDGSGSSDPDGTIVSYVWDFDTLVDSDGDGDPANDADATTVVATWTYYDDYFTLAQLTVVDDDGLSAWCTVAVTVLNVPPTVDFEGAFVEVEVCLRLAGSKWSNVELLIVTDYDPENETWDSEILVLEVERWPGPPDQNPTSTGEACADLKVDVSSEEVYTAIITYDPYPDQGDAILGDQPNNGKDPFDNAGNPVWLILTYADGSECRKHHTFNTQQSMIRDSEHWNHVEPWIVDLDFVSVGVPIEFVGSATDPGSDDLTFTWDWGDANWTSTTYLYDPVRGPDPGYPPGSPYEPYGAPWDPFYTTSTGPTPPITVTDTQFYTYGAEGTYTVTLTVTDDDGGVSWVSFEVTVTGQGCP